MKSLCRILCVSVALLLAAAPALAEKTYRLDIRPQPLAEALRTFAQQSGLQIVYYAQVVEGRTARAVTGDFSASEALKQLLAETDLTFEAVDEETVAIRAAAKPDRTSADGTQDTNLRLTQVGQTNKSTEASAEQERSLMQKVDDTSKPEDSPTDAQKADTEAEVRVTGSRIRRDPAETDFSPVNVFTRKDIERTGAITMADFLGRITQSTYTATRELGSGTADDIASPGANSTVVTLRGLGNNTTLVLLNGRRLPKFGQGFGNDAYDLSGIPLAAVERIEVLTNSASAIYGSDAIAGVVNVITRKDYSGIDVTAQYGNTFDSDVSERSLNLLFGHAGEAIGHHTYSFTVNLSANSRNALSALDRPYTAKSDYSDSGGAPPPEPDPFGIAGGAGVVSIPFSEFDPDAMHLPGLPASAAALPSGQDGRNLTAADFLASNDVPVNASLDRAKYRMLFSPTEEQSASGSATFDLTSYAQLFFDGQYSRSRSDSLGAPPSSAQIPVPANNPFNPFGVDVFVNKVFYELGPSETIFENTTAAAAAGVRGSLLKGRLDDWRYEISGDYSRHIDEFHSPMPQAISFRRRLGTDEEGNPVIVNTPASIAIRSTDRATAVNVFGDGRTTQPNDPDFLRSLLGVNRYREASDTWTGSMQADGVIARLRGGPMKLAVGAEYRSESVTFGKLNTIGREVLTLDDGASADSQAAFAELSIPILGPQWNFRGARSLELSLAGRLDSESVFGEEFTPKVGLIWRPLAGLALRSTYGHGYKTPNVQQLYAPDNTGESSYFPAPIDPVTDMPIDYEFLQRNGGNPGLNPERSQSWSSGVIVEPAFAPGLSLSVDYFDIKYIDRIANFIQLEDLLTFFPERVQRDPDTRRVIFVDARAVNLSRSRSRGIDVKLVHALRTSEHGTFDTQVSYTYNIESSQRSTPAAPVFEGVDKFIPRVRANATEFWSYRGLELGSTVSYEASTANFFSFGIYRPARIRHAVVMDLQGSVNLDEYRGGRFGPGWLSGTKLTVGIDNVLDRVPSPTDGNGGFDKVDPRQRRYYFTLHKTF